ncbi:hypothetical protein [Streptomyces sp. NPDC059479]|uniref:hypothetical protein n=1 Tax=Streptomyces sp. NPDC059479 TaxID=3346848 RepID=UPI00369F59BA
MAAAESVDLDGRSLRPWLLGVATNTARNTRRAARRHEAAVGRLPRAGREEMARLLPVPADRELPGRRHQLLKDHLMHEVRQHTTTGRTASRPLRRRLALAAVPPAAGAVAAVIPATGSLSDNGPAGAGSPGPTVASGPSAAVLLDRIAVAAASRPTRGHSSNAHGR